MDWLLMLLMLLISVLAHFLGYALGHKVGYNRGRQDADMIHEAIVEYPERIERRKATNAPETSREP